MNCKETTLFEMLKFPYPFQAAFVIASDIDSANLARFRAIHSLLSEASVVRADSVEWRTLGLKRNSPLFDSASNGIQGFGFGFSDSFYLVADPTTYGMYRYSPADDSFSVDIDNGENCSDLIKIWLAQGKIDTFHTFHHFTRKQIKPLLMQFYNECATRGIPKPLVWTNHSMNNTPTGICPNELQPSRFYRLARLTARSVVGPIFGRTRLPIRYALTRYDGDTPGSPYYINDILASNNLRFVWVNHNDIHSHRITLPEVEISGRNTILHAVTMDDGVRYWRFERCFDWKEGDPRRESYLRTSSSGADASHIITKANLDLLCRDAGTCILYCHWAHDLSFPLAPDTLERLALLKTYQSKGRIWTTALSRLLEWTRLRTFLNVQASRLKDEIIINIESVDDPLFGCSMPRSGDLQGLAFKVPAPSKVKIAFRGAILPPDAVRREADGVFWLDIASAKIREAADTVA